METQLSLRSLGFYLVIWLGQNISILASSVSKFIVIWYVAILTSDPSTIPFTNMIILLPLLLFPAFAGIFSDLLSRKRIIIIISFLKVINLLTIIITLTESTIILLFLLILEGILDSFFLPALFSVIPIMVPQKQLGRINGLNYLSTTIIMINAPALALYLLDNSSYTIVLWIALFLIGVSIIPIVLIKFPNTKSYSSDQLKKNKKNFLFKYFNQFISGIKSCIINSGFFIIFGSYILLNVIIERLDSITLNFLSTVHSANFFEVSLFISSNYLGMIIGAVLAIIIKYWKPTLIIFFASNFLIMLLYLILGLAPIGAFSLILPVTFIIGIIPAISYTIFFSVMQTTIPKQNIGHVYGIFLSISSLFTLISTIYFPYFLAFFTVKTTFLWISIIGIIFFIAFFTMVKLIDIRFDDYLEINI